ncbi:MAG: hypothetical protein JXL80_05105 [Planctomycetes bacterium]|nr:hypothetical protein [Planctomycetota bacterium]
MTLLELLVVVALLAVTAGMVVSATDVMDRRQRHETTQQTLATVRRALLGPDPTAGMPPGGFLADMGWPPTDESDLWDAERFPVNESREADDPRNVRRLYDATWQTYRGWAGPYLSLPPVYADGKRDLRDGWGQPLTGWRPEAWPTESRFWTSVLGSLPEETNEQTLYHDLEIHSPGPLPDGSESVPADGTALIASREWTVDVSDWAVQLTNSGQQSVTLNLSSCCWMVVVPVWRAAADDSPRVYLDHWPESDEERAVLGHVGDALPAQVIVPAGGTTTVYFGRQDAAARPRYVPVGRRMLFLVTPVERQGDSDGSPLRASPDVLKDSDGHVKPLGQVVWIWPGLSPPTIEFDVAGLSKN